MSNAWNPDLYLKFKRERTQPAIDLCKRVELVSPKKILDVGCGPGNSTAILRDRWPDAMVTGLNNSPEMINKAKLNYPDGQWVLANATEYSEKGYDLIFSNAAIHWMPDHENLLSHLMSLLNENGILAVQVPSNRDAGINKAIYNATQHETFKEINFQRDFVYKTVDFYYEILSKISNDFALWETNYIHVLDGHEDIVQWYKSTGLKGYLSTLPTEELKQEFEDVVLENCKQEYTLQSNGNVLFPFNRLFFIARK